MTPTTRAVAFADLDARTAYDLWRLRQDVFVVEQACPYPDLDGRDTEPGTRHVLLHDGDDLVGCARVLDDGDVWRVGRVLLAPAARGRGLAEPLVRACLDACPGRDVVLDAQSPLRELLRRVRLRGQRPGVPRGRDPAPADAVART